MNNDDNKYFHGSLLLDEQDEETIFEAFFDDMASPNQTTPEADALLNALSSVELEISILYYAIEKGLSLDLAQKLVVEVSQQSEQLKDGETLTPSFVDKVLREIAN